MMTSENEETSGASINPAHKLRERLQENRNALKISRIPEKTRTEFIKLAEEEFCGDYGMALKWLMDDMVSQDSRVFMSALEDHEARLQAIEQVMKREPTNKEEPNVRKMLDGTKRRVGGNK